MPAPSRIGCLGWGSLVWDPRSLPVANGWFRDGPLLPVEFARESTGGRITLVIADVPRDVQVLWALLGSADLDSAKRALACREGMTGALNRRIGWWMAGEEGSRGESSRIGEWASTKRLDGVVWTALKPGFVGHRGVVPSEADVLQHLRDLSPARQDAAGEYIRNAPAQIVTPYRKRIEEEFGWLPSPVAASGLA